MRKARIDLAFRTLMVYHRLVSVETGLFCHVIVREARQWEER
jgi:hypothetical protein